MSIRFRFALFVLMSVFIVMVLFQAYSIKTQYDQVPEELRTKSQLTADLMAMSLSDPLWNYNQEGLKTAGDAPFLDSEIGMVEVFTNIGRNVYQRQGAGEAYDTARLTFAEKRIIRENRDLGVVKVGITDYYRISTLKAEVISAMVNLALIMFLLWLLINFISKRITRPIDELAAGAEEIASGRLERRLVIDSNDEIGRLARKFNIMADSLSEMIAERDEAAAELAEAIRKLESQNRELESEVKERQEIQIALAASEEKYSKAFLNATDAIGLVYLSNQHYFEASEAYFRILGYSREEVIGHPSSEFDLWVYPVQRQEIYNLLAQGNSIRNMEVYWRTQGGEVRIGLLSTEFVDVSSEPCIIFIWHDITERKQAEEELQKLNAELERKVSDRTRDLRAANQELQTSNNEIFNVNKSLALEITERVKTEKRLEDSNQELSATIRMLKETQAQLVQSEKMASLGSLVAGVAHEINTPIGVSVTAVTNLSRLTTEFVACYQSGQLKRKDLDDYIDDCLTAVSILTSNLERASHLIRSFKQVSVDQSSEGKRIFNLKEYLGELLMSLHPRLKKTRISVAVRCDDSLNVESYPGAYAQIITNMVINSLLHAYEPGATGQIEIEAAVNDERLQLIYSDDGKGITPEVQKHIFDPFYTTNRASGGTGLGLHIVYNIVTMQLQGSITCESETGHGARFIMTLPLHIADSPR